MEETGCCSELVMEAEPVWLGPLPPAVLKDSAATLRWEVEVEDGKWVRYPPRQQLAIESAFVRGNVDSVRVTVAGELEFYRCKCEHTLRIAVPRLQFLLPNTPRTSIRSLGIRCARTPHAHTARHGATHGCKGLNSRRAWHFTTMQHSGSCCSVSVQNHSQWQCQWWFASSGAWRVSPARRGHLAAEARPSLCLFAPALFAPPQAGDRNASLIPQCHTVTATPY